MMSEHRATIAWRRGAAAPGAQPYSSDHTWSFNDALEVTAQQFGRRT